MSERGFDLDETGPLARIPHPAHAPPQSAPEPEPFEDHFDLGNLTEVQLVTLYLRVRAMLGRHLNQHDSSDSVEYLLARIAELSEAAGAQPSRTRLTARELEVLHLMAKSYSDRRIAAVLFISENTVHQHVAHIREKYEVSNRQAAVLAAIREGVLSVD